MAIPTSLRIAPLNRAQRARRAAFTLTEIAIVLGIIGIIIGGIWAAGGSVGTKDKINRASDELNITKAGLFAYFSSQNVSYSGINGANGAPTLSAAPLAVPSSSGKDFCYYTPPPVPTNMGLVKQGVFAKQMLASGGTIANNAWDRTDTYCGGTVGTAQVSLACSTCSAGSPVLGGVRYTNVPLSACAQMLLLNSTPGPDTRLFMIAVTPSGGSTTSYSGTQLPISASTANTACTGTSTTTFTIDWYYQLGG